MQSPSSGIALRNWITAIVFCGVPVCAQLPRVPPPPPPSGEVATFTSETREVPIYVTILDRHGNLITDIPREAFTIYEDDHEQTLKTFVRDDVPVSMGILIDSSGSMRDKQSRVSAAALALVRESNPDDEVFFVNFNDDPILDQPFTNDIKKLEEAMDRIDSSGGTAMRNAISASIDYTMEEGRRNKKVLVVVTDGNDNASNAVKLEDLVRKVRDSEVIIYTIGLLNEESRRDRKAAQRALDALTEASGGFAYYPETLAEVKEITPRIAHEIRNQYILTYTPTNMALDGSFRRLRVEVDGIGRRDTVRHRSGYFAENADLEPAPPEPPASTSELPDGLTSPRRD